MKKRSTKHESDPNVNAARIVHEATCREPEKHADADAAFEAWSASIHGLDERMRTMLRAAFDVGVEFGRRALAIQGASKGGTARAAKLSESRRRSIAKRAAAVRWKQKPTS